MQNEVEASGQYLSVPDLNSTALYFDAHEVASQALLNVRLPLRHKA